MRFAFSLLSTLTPLFSALLFRMFLQGRIPCRSQILMFGSAPSRSALTYVSEPSMTLMTLMKTIPVLLFLHFRRTIPPP